MKKILFELLSSLKPADLKSDTISFSMQVGAVLLNLLVNLLLTHIMPHDAYGAFAYASTLIFVLTGIGAFGTLSLLTRDVGAAHGNLPVAKSLLNWSLKRSLIFSVVLLVVFIFISIRFELFFGAREMSEYRIPFLICMGAIPFLVIIYICQAYFQGLRKIFHALFGEKTVRPALLLIIALTFFFVAGQTEISFADVALFNLTAFIIAMLVVTVPVFNSLRNIQPEVIGNERLNAWKKSAATFFLFSIVSLIYLRADILSLGFFTDGNKISTGEIGVYNIACRISEMSAFPLHVLTFGLSPLIASAYAKGEKEKLQKIVTSSSRIIFVLCLIPAIIFFIAGKSILGLFGHEFLEGYSPFILLIFGNLLNAIAGPAGYILVMTGHEREAVISMTAACIVSIAMNFVLIPIYGITGAAIAVCCGYFTWNTLIVFFAIARTGIRPDVFFLLKKNEG